MSRPGFSLVHQDPRIVELIAITDHKVLACWSRDCAERVLPFFEEKYPDDPRPRKALGTLQAWIDTGVFSMNVIRGASLGSHAAARECNEDSPGRSAARAAGQAVATAHVRTHAIGGAMYALQAIYRNAEPGVRDARVTDEREWQYRHLLEMRKRDCC